MRAPKRFLRRSLVKALLKMLNSKAPDGEEEVGDERAGLWAVAKDHFCDCAAEYEEI